MGTAIWAGGAAAGTTMVGAEAAITVGDIQPSEPVFLEAASLGGFFIDSCALPGQNRLFARAPLPEWHDFAAPERLVLDVPPLSRQSGSNGR